MAGRPCSFLSRSLRSIKRQFDAQEEERLSAAMQRERKRSSRADESARNEAEPSEDEPNDVESDEDEFIGFHIPDDDDDM